MTNDEPISTSGRWTRVPSDLPLMLTTTEAAALLGVSAKHVRCMLAKGALTGARVGGCWRVNRDALLASVGLA